MGSVLKGLFIASVLLGAFTFYKRSQSNTLLNYPGNYSAGDPIRATCILEGSIYGTIYLEQPTGKICNLFTHGDQFTVIKAEIFGLSKGLHGFHIHENGDLSDGCKAAGPHYNPFDKVIS